MAGGQSRGRQRIPLIRINNRNGLYATFSKRRLGLQRKASELSTLCGADVGMIIFSPTNKPFSFWHPTMESVIGRYRNPNQPLDEQARYDAASARYITNYLNGMLDEVLDEIEQFKAEGKRLDEIKKEREKVWWEEIPVKNSTTEQISGWEASIEDFKNKVRNRINELKNGASSSSAAPFQPQIAPDTFGSLAPADPDMEDDMYYQDFPAKPSYFPSNLPASHFPEHDYNIRPDAQLPIAGGEADYVPDYYIGPPYIQYPLASGGVESQEGRFNYFPPEAHEDPSTSGARGEEASITSGTGEPMNRDQTGEAGPNCG